MVIRDGGGAGEEKEKPPAKKEKNSDRVPAVVGRIVPTRSIC